MMMFDNKKSEVFEQSTIQHYMFDLSLYENDQIVFYLTDVVTLLFFFLRVNLYPGYNRVDVRVSNTYANHETYCQNSSKNIQYPTAHF